MTSSTRSRYPVVTPEMVKPEGVPIPTVVAKRLFAAFMVEVGFLERREVADHVRYFAEAMREHEDGLRDDLARVKAEVEWQRPAFKNGIAEARRELAACKDPTERSELEEELAEQLEELASFESELREAKDAVYSFRRDKRAFLVEYINRELHGH